MKPFALTLGDLAGLDIVLRREAEAAPVTQAVPDAGQWGWFAAAGLRLRRRFGTVRPKTGSCRCAVPPAGFHADHGLDPSPPLHPSIIHVRHPHPEPR